MPICWRILTVRGYPVTHELPYLDFQGVFGCAPPLSNTLWKSGLGEASTVFVFCLFCFHACYKMQSLGLTTL